MSDVTTQPKTTPARRRPGRQNARSGGQKAYASENDASMVDASYGPRYHGTPQTPSKAGAASGSPAVAASNPNSSSANAAYKQRNKNKTKGKNQPASPESGHRGGQTPPQHSASAKPAAVAAYAGATFHASPAPSALPMPSFLSKISSESPAQTKTRNIAQEPSPPATDTDAPTPFRPSSVPRTEESPLDFMFRAHRQEREQHRRGSLADQRPPVLGTASPPSFSPFEARNSPRATTVPQTRRPEMRRSASGIDSAELDGTPGQPIGPAFSTPYQERIKAARTNAPRASPKQAPQGHPLQPAQQDPTEALKKFLFSGGAAAGANPGPPNGAAPPPTSAPPGYNTSPSPAHVGGPGQDRPNNIQAMENDLRRILKMDVASGPPNPERRVFSQ